MTKTAVESEIESFRQCVIASRSDPGVAARAEHSIERLRAMYAKHPDLFSQEDVRFVNVMRGFLGVRLAAHHPAPPAAKRGKRKGDTLDHCWRCKTPVDDRFTEICPTCDSKAYHWRICPVCQACGCQRDGKVLV